MTTTQESTAVVSGAENVEKELQTDPVGAVTYRTIVNGLAEIAAANEVLLESDDKTKVTDIDKALKEKDKLPKNIKELVEKLEKARESFKKAQEAARNTYRVEVLKEEATVDHDIDKDAVVESRKLVMESLKFLKLYADAQKKTSFSEWADKVSVPQVGRQGSSSAGAKKPRVYVKVDDTVYDSFTLAAAGLSTKEKKVTASELAEAWNTANGGQEGGFEFGGHTIVITNKPKKSDK